MTSLDHPIGTGRPQPRRRSRRHLAIAATAFLLPVAGGGLSYTVGAEVMHGVDLVPAMVR